MPREIKFRAKTLSYDPMTMPQWAEGYYYTELHRGEMRHLITDGAHTFEVDADTLGQFIGLCDCKNTPIYEGDIVIGHNEEGTRPIKAVVKYGIVRREVKRINLNVVDIPCFYFEDMETKENLLPIIDNPDEPCGIAVIGNIHDAPSATCKDE